MPQNHSRSVLSGNRTNPDTVPGHPLLQCLSCTPYWPLTRSPKHKQMSLVLFTVKLEIGLGCGNAVTEEREKSNDGAVPYLRGARA